MSDPEEKLDSKKGDNGLTFLGVFGAAGLGEGEGVTWSFP
jgi:hypothetical protein